MADSQGRPKACLTCSAEQDFWLQGDTIFKLQGDSRFNLSLDWLLLFPINTMLTKEPEMLQLDAFCKHTWYNAVNVTATVGCWESLQHSLRSFSWFLRPTIETHVASSIYSSTNEKSALNSDWLTFAQSIYATKWMYARVDVVNET